MSKKIITLRVNAREHEVMVEPMTTLQEVLREELGLKGVKAGCQQGGCGSCSVLIDGALALSCILPAQAAVGREITTIEALSDGALHPIQQAFVDAYATQCGFCTPGMILATKALLDRKPQPSREEIAAALSGNICRCTGYAAVLRAVEEAAKRLASGPAGG